MDAAVILKYKHSRLLHKQLRLLAQEEVRGQDSLTPRQLRLRRLKVKLDRKLIHKFHDGIGVFALLHHLDQIAQQSSSLGVGVAPRLLGRAALAEQDCGGEIPKKVGGVGGHGLEVLFGSEEFHHALQSLARGIVPEDEETPVQQPCALMERFEGGELVRCCKRFDGRLHGDEGDGCLLPVFHENFAGEFAPKDIEERGINRS
mmetsp:Transcript_12649/g.21813  ORF Transcript_12649/g.21813 Transcript_12649/m.21813 type:complete len:203 (-) Transcript_12649:833-1441(-)